MVFVLQGFIVSLKENEGVIQSEEHGELQFETRENLSDVDFTEEDINEGVEFTVLPVRFFASPAALGAVIMIESRFDLCWTVL